MSNDCLFVEKKEVVNYADSFFLQKIDELRLRPDVVLRKKTPVNHTPSGVFTICLPTASQSLLIKANIQLTVIDCVTFDFVLAKLLTKHYNHGMHNKFINRGLYIYKKAAQKA